MQTCWLTAIILVKNCEDHLVPENSAKTNTNLPLDSGLWLLLSVAVSAYLISCYQTASDADYYMIHTVFIAITTSCLEEFAPQANKSFQCSNV